MVSGINGSSANSIIYELMRDKKIVASADDESKQSEETMWKNDTVTISDAARPYSPPAALPDFSSMSDDELISWLRDAEAKYGITLAEDGSKSVDELTSEDLQYIREALSAGPGGRAGGPQGAPPNAQPLDFSSMSDDELISWLRDAEAKYGVTFGEDGSKSVDELTSEDLQSIREALSAGPGGRTGGPQGPPPTSDETDSGFAAKSEADESLANYIAELRERLMQEYAQSPKASVSYLGNPAMQAAITAYTSY
jgi:hypothetical protein